MSDNGPDDLRPFRQCLGSNLGAEAFLGTWQDDTALDL